MMSQWQAHVMQQTRSVYNQSMGAIGMLGAVKFDLWIMGWAMSIMGAAVGQTSTEASAESLPQESQLDEDLRRFFTRLPSGPDLPPDVHPRRGKAWWKATTRVGSYTIYASSTAHTSRGVGTCRIKLFRPGVGAFYEKSAQGATIDECKREVDRLAEILRRSTR